MRISINLASQPFRRVRAMLLASVAVSLALMATLAVLISLILTDRTQMADVRRDIDRLSRQNRQAGAQEATLAAVLKRPENAEVLERSVFINTLLYRKGISWTRIFSDLEKTLPYNVKIVAIHPTLDSQNHVILDMTIASETAEAAIQGEIALENSPLFGELVQHQSQPPSQAYPLYTYRLTVNYAQEL